ncbi:MaoC family dehydratase [Mesorhizobium sp. YIM 152430]|uniref:MaoC family dehydratase n=1 Tax=Mesorhizobium sp. YIM 152430 TaxID=3031761 RepID=UPI0023DBA180|nr:MaoC family dehydratase [Mesorhizobium sp. YIM 152430]MDF1598577.1 MaoC family dehydratase [Mesorhizobium sp. YIM 152430]
MTEKRWAFEDFTVGRTIVLPEKHVTAEEIIDFASQFDAQPMHLDEAAGKASILGGLAASGWHTCAMFMRMMCDAFLNDSTSQGAPGVDYVRWKKPVIAGDTLTGRSTITAARVSAKRPGLGFVTVEHRLFNQKGETVLELANTGMFLLREPGAAA